VAKTRPNKAKPTPSTGAGRRDRLASFEAARKKEQRRRSFLLLGVCLVLAAALLSYPIYLAIKDSQLKGAAISTLGSSLADAGCDPVVENPASGNQDHQPVGTPITYPQTPPNSGPHYDTPAPFAKHFYSTGDRPAVPTLVHNLEHGYTIAWYRDTTPQDQVDALESISRTFSTSLRTQADFSSKFIAAPWSEADGPAFPAGKNVVLTRWYADPQAPADAAKQKGVSQACTSVSGAAVEDFMKKYPFQDSPEPNAA
jgi:hypothetical protein